MVRKANLIHHVVATLLVAGLAIANLDDARARAHWPDRRIKPLLAGLISLEDLHCFAQADNRCAPDNTLARWNRALEEQRERQDREDSE
jgi:hypothetical protein